VRHKKHPKIYCSSLEDGLSDFYNFWYEYSRHNCPSNGHLFSRLTTRLFLHYMGKKNKQNITFLFNTVWLFDSNNTHLAHFVQISSTLADSLSNYPVVQPLSVNIQNIGLLCKHRQGDAFSIHWYRRWYCSVPDFYQLLLDFTDIFKQRPINLLQ